MSNFNRNRPQPAAPTQREIRHVIPDLESGAINTNTRYGRKQIWKQHESAAYIKTLLEGKQTDPISVSRVVHQGLGLVDNNVNGNNRCRSILSFKNNDFGAEGLGDDGNTYDYYFSAIPASELMSPRRRAKCRVLDDASRNMFLRYPLLFNIRENLTEQEEIRWYRALNSSLKPHKAGHMLTTDLCDQDNEFANDFLRTFPAMKVRVNEEPVESDRESLGCVLADITGVEVDPMAAADKDENVLQKHAVIYNILDNGTPFYHEFRGTHSPANLARNTEVMKEIFTRAAISDELKQEMASATRGKPYLPRLYDPGYLLGPMAWSIATNQPRAQEIWTEFLSNCNVNDIDEVYVKEVSKSKHGDEAKQKYEKAWNKLVEHMG